MLQDAHKRPLRDLRISVTDRCNFRCPYCMPAAIFGEAYRRYRRSVPAFFPRLRRDYDGVLDPSPVTFDSAVLKRTAIDSSYFLVAILAVELLGWLQSARLVTPIFRLL